MSSTRLKYYLRGLGIGIIVTAVIMGVSTGTKELTDAQIVERAKELGMVDGVLAQLPTVQKENTEKPADAAKADATKADTAEPTEKTEDTAKTDAAKADAEKVEDAAKAEDTAKADVTKTDAAKPEDTAKADVAKDETAKPEPEVVSKIVITIYPGEGSYTVSRKLAALGLVESADIYDKFLCQNGYDKKLITGNHEIEAGMTADEIARALTRR